MVQKTYNSSKFDIIIEFLECKNKLITENLNTSEEILKTWLDSEVSDNMKQEYIDKFKHEVTKYSSQLDLINDMIIFLKKLKS